MKFNEFISQLIEVFEDTDPKRLTPDCYFKELEEYSSLTSLAIIATVDEKYNVIISAAEIRECDTLQDLFDLIVSKIKYI